jgi:hypothetical protein
LVISDRDCPELRVSEAVIQKAGVMTQIEDHAGSPAVGEAQEDLPVPIARELLERAKAEGVSLVGPGGLLAGVTKNLPSIGRKLRRACTVSPARSPAAAMIRSATDGARCRPGSAHQRLIPPTPILNHRVRYSTAIADIGGTLGVQVAACRPSTDLQSYLPVEVSGASLRRSRYLRKRYDR